MEGSSKRGLVGPSRPIGSNSGNGNSNGAPPVAKKGKVMEFESLRLHSLPNASQLRRDVLVVVGGRVISY